MSLWEHDTLTLPRGARRWRRKARRFAQEHIRPLAPEADLHPHEYDPKPLLAAAAREGFQTLLAPWPLGSASLRPYLGGAALQVAVVGEELATECGGLALLLLAHNLGIVPLLLSGSLRVMVRHFIPFYLGSRVLGRPGCMAFAITEPEAGSDAEETAGGAAARLVTTAKYMPGMGGYVLNGRKCFISDGAIADKVTVYAKIEGEGIESWTCFLVEKGMKGFSVGRSERKMGQRASDASELVFDNVFVPKKNVVGRVRSGWPNNRNVLNYSRPVVGAMALGHGRGAFGGARSSAGAQTRAKEAHRIGRADGLADMAISLWAHPCSGIAASSGATSPRPRRQVFASDTAFKYAAGAGLMGDAAACTRTVWSALARFAAHSDLRGDKPDQPAGAVRAPVGTVYD